MAVGMFVHIRVTISHSIRHTRTVHCVPVSLVSFSLVWLVLCDSCCVFLSPYLLCPVLACELL